MSGMEWYLVGICGVAFLVTVIDKIKAIGGWYRIPEKTLLLLAFLGGGAGVWLGMIATRHKIRKPLFAIGVPVITLLELGFYFYLKSHFFA